MSAPPRRFRLLLMSVGSLVGTGLLECIEALGRDRFELIGMNSEVGAVSNFRMDVCYLSPPARQRQALLALLDEVVRRHEPDLVVPTRDDDVVALARWAGGRRSARAMVGSVRMAEVIRDKWTSYRWATDRGLPFARSAIDAAGVARLSEEVGFPLVAKPREGFGSNGVRMLLNDRHAAVALAAGDTVVQEAIDPSPMLTAEALDGGMPLWFAPVQPGSPLTLSLLDDDGCQFLAAWWSRHVRGAALDTVLLQEPALERLATDYAQAAWREGWRGLFNIQARRNARGEYVPIELAGRFMGGTSALHRLGIPVAAIVFQRLVEGFDLPAPIEPLFDARAVKQVATHVVTAAQESTLREAGFWHRG
jgi:carbamoyl-phosphate synthase large subunit